MTVSSKSTLVEAGDGESHVSAVLRGGEVRESGIAPAYVEPPGGAELAEDVARHAESALAETTRLDGNLSQLLRGLERLSAGTYAAREANASLTRELDEALCALKHYREAHQAMSRRVAQLESELGTVRREREHFIRQEDAFLYELIDDHEQQIRFLNEQVAALTAENHAVSELATEEERPTLVPPPTSQGKAKVASVKLRTLKIPRSRGGDVAEPLCVAGPGGAADAPPGAEAAVGAERGPSQSSDHEPAIPTDDRSASRSPSGYALRVGDVADEYVDITQVKGVPKPE
jgi:hypothetical protein